MTSQQAITLLRNLEQSLDDYCELNDEGKTAFGKAITALELFGNSEQLPSVQPERKTGKWIWKTLDVYKCSECETETHVDECMEEPIYNFCPYCGARMLQEGEDNDG